MKKFMDENFLLKTETAQELYHNHAAKMPIIDYHCHLIPKMVADDYQFKSITEIWLGGDHYKWRAMRSNGVDERYCTGKDTTDWEKFEKWAETVPYTFRNPLYHWTHLELKTCFGIDKILNPSTAREIFDECNAKLATPEYTARNLMRRYHVETVCTTDDPVDSLEYHIATRESGFEIKMLPTWRPDKAMAVEVPADFRAYMEKLSEVSGVTISSFDDMVAALRKRHEFFAEQGCKLSDHGIEEFYAEDYTDAEIRAIFNKVYGSTELTKEEILNKIATLTGGRAAEEIVFGSVTTGASNDIEQATKLARAMITRYGMTCDFDMVAMEVQTNQYLGGDSSLTCSAETQTKIDEKVVEVVRSEHEKAAGILMENREKLDDLARYLYEKETITGEEFMNILNA